MVTFSNHLKKLLDYSWISSIMLRSSSTSVEKSSSSDPPSSSSFVSCDHIDLHVSDVEMGWVPVEHPSCSNTTHQSTNSFPASCQFERSMSSSSFQVEGSVSSSSFQFTITVEETDWVVLDVPITLVTSILNPLPPVSSLMADHSASSLNQAASNSSSSSISTTTAAPPPPVCSSSYRAPTPCSTSSASSANGASLSSSSSSVSSSSYHMDNSISTAPSPSSSSSSSSLSCSSSLSSSSSSNHAPTSTLSTQSSLSSTVSNHASAARSARVSSHAIFIMHSSFKWHEILLAISFTVPVGLLSATFERHKGVLVPAKLFNSNPNLFLIFIILDALAFTASVIGILLQALGRRRNRSCLSYLSLIAFTTLVFAFSIYLSVLLPNFLGFIPWTLLIAILLVLLYVGVSMYN